MFSALIKSTIDFNCGSRCKVSSIGQLALYTPRIGTDTYTHPVCHPRRLGIGLGYGAESPSPGKRAQNETPGHVLGSRSSEEGRWLVCRVHHSCKRAFVNHCGYTRERGVSSPCLTRTGRWR